MIIRAEQAHALADKDGAFSSFDEVLYRIYKKIESDAREGFFNLLFEVDYGIDENLLNSLIHELQSHGYHVEIIPRCWSRGNDRIRIHW